MLALSTSWKEKKITKNETKVHYVNLELEMENYPNFERKIHNRTEIYMKISLQNMGTSWRNPVDAITRWFLSLGNLLKIRKTYPLCWFLVFRWFNRHFRIKLWIWSFSYHFPGWTKLQFILNTKSKWKGRPYIVTFDSAIFLTCQLILLFLTLGGDFFLFSVIFAPFGLWTIKKMKYANLL